MGGTQSGLRFDEKTNADANAYADVTYEDFYQDGDLYEEYYNDKFHYHPWIENQIKYIKTCLGDKKMSNNKFFKHYYTFLYKNYPMSFLNVFNGPNGFTIPIRMLPDQTREIPILYSYQRARSLPRMIQSEGLPLDGNNMPLLLENYYFEDAKYREKAKENDRRLRLILEYPDKSSAIIGGPKEKSIRQYIDDLLEGYEDYMTGYGESFKYDTFREFYNDIKEKQGISLIVNNITMARNKEKQNPGGQKKYRYKFTYPLRSEYLGSLIYLDEFKKYVCEILPHSKVVKKLVRPLSAQSDEKDSLRMLIGKSKLYDPNLVSEIAGYVNPELSVYSRMEYLKEELHALRKYIETERGIDFNPDRYPNDKRLADRLFSLLGEYNNLRGTK